MAAVGTACGECSDCTKRISDTYLFFSFLGNVERLAAFAFELNCL